MATSFHGFMVKEKIGSGGMSTVYKGIHETLGYPVAIKVLHPGMAGDKSFIARFEREAKAASSLRNNNIASVIDFGSEDDIYFIVMEFVSGQDLGQVLSDLKESDSEIQSMPLEIVLSIIEEVAYGLKDAHEQGIIHRDIKPTNILLDKRGEVKIADFGLARDTSDINQLSEADLTVPGTVVGTPSFMSPEQAAGRELDSRTDIFSLGVMAYQLLMGEKPFVGKTAIEVQEAIINQDPPALTRERCPLLTVEVENLITKMLAKDPNRRFQNMDQVLRSLSESMESVDSSGSLIKFKREYLNKFSLHPLEFSKELRRKGIATHLTQGYHFKKMGLSNIDDAIREFTYVLSLDPGNEKASEAIAELIKNAEESGIVPAYQQKPAGEFDAGSTQVLVTSPPPRKPTAQAKPPTAPRQKKPLLGIQNPLHLYGGGAAAVLILILAVVFWPRGGDQEEAPVKPVQEEVVAQVPAQQPEEKPEAVPEKEETTVDLAEETPPTPVPEAPPEEVEVAEEIPPAPVQGTLKITSEPAGASVYIKPSGAASFQRAGTTPLTTEKLEVGQWEIRVEQDGYIGRSKVFGVQEGIERPLAFKLEPKVAPRTDPGFIRVIVSPYGDIYLDEELKAEDTRVEVISASSGKNHRLRIHHRATVGDIVLDNLKVSPGDTLDIGRQIFSVGTLKVASNISGVIKVDGVALPGETPVTAERVLVGDHLVSIHKGGVKVDKFWVFGSSGKTEVKPVNPGAGELLFPITMVKGETLRIKFDLKVAD